MLAPQLCPRHNKGPGTGKQASGRDCDHDPQTVSVSQKVDAGGYTLGADGVTLTPTATLQARI